MNDSIEASLTLLNVLISGTLIGIGALTLFSFLELSPVLTLVYGLIVAVTYTAMITLWAEKALKHSSEKEELEDDHIIVE